MKGILVRKTKPIYEVRTTKKQGSTPLGCVSEATKGLWCPMTSTGRDLRPRGSRALAVVALVDYWKYSPSLRRQHGVVFADPAPTGHRGMARR